MELIGLSGYARSGKDEAAKILVEEYGFKQVAFADKLREVLYALNPIIPIPMYSMRDIDTDFLLDLPTDSYPKLQTIIDRYGWNGYKETVFGVEIRRLLQRLGTEAGRQTLWDTIWIDAALKEYDGTDAKIVISDARFFNEFEAIRSRGGRLWRIERNGVGPVSDHPSETEAVNYKHFDVFIPNDGTLESYRRKIKEYYENW